MNCYPGGSLFGLAFPRIMKAVLLFLSLVLVHEFSWSKEERINVIFILADDVGYEQLGCYGGLQTDTPELDRIAEEGILFERAYTSPVCTPSRMSIYTGLYGSHHKMMDVLPIHEGSRSKVDFDRDFACYAEKLREEGYRTAVTGKWQLGALEYYPDHPNSAGFDEWCIWQIWHDDHKSSRYWNPLYNQNGKLVPVTETSFGPDIMRDFVIGFMRESVESGKPFFIHHNLVLPHVPITRVPGQDVSSAGSLKDMIHYLDREVGQIKEEIFRLGIEDHTILIFLGDNGTESAEVRYTRDGAVSGGKYDLNDAGMHVPLIAWGPCLAKHGITSDSLIDSTDLFATFLDLTGVVDREKLATLSSDSRSFAPLLLGGTYQPRQFVTGAYQDDWVVFDGEWRLHAKDHQLIDCRDLPSEKIADNDSKETRDAMLRLLGYMIQMDEPTHP